VEPNLMVRQDTQLSTNNRQRALIAECQAFERRWAELHEEALRLDQAWQLLLSTLSSRVDAKRNGQPPSWADGALLFFDLDKHAERTSSLALEALQTCHRYAQALQQAMDGLADG